MPEVALVIIDDFLIRGQITLHWCSQLETDLVIVVNDKVQQNKMQQGILDMCLPEEIFARYYSLEQAQSKMQTIDSSRNAILVCENLNDFKQLYDNGVTTSHLILSSQKKGRGRKNYTNDVSLSNEEILLLKELQKNGIKIEFRQSPFDSTLTLSQVLSLN